MIFDISTGDDDGNAAGNGDPISHDQMIAIMDLIAETETNIEAFCTYLRVDAIKNLPASKYETAINALNAKKAKANV
jgi:hypothetical protein